VSGHEPSALVVAAAEADPAAQRGRHGALTAALYVGFALLAVAGNLGAQWLVTRVLGPYSMFLIELVAGTGVGVVIKFLLDRAFIFDDSAKQRPVAKQATLYLMTSVATTILFWGGEGLCVLLLGKTDARFAVGAFVLSVGYLLKYQLDKRITFA
jgi:hypothetical protein